MLNSLFYTAAIIFALFGVNGALAQTILSKDHNEIAYDVVGNGSTAIVFVHGWACNRTFWTEQPPYFLKEFTVVTLDLAGHGESGNERVDWTIDAFAEDVASVVNGLYLEEVFLVGHSLGGLVVIEAAHKLPHQTTGVILVDELMNTSDRYSWFEEMLVYLALKISFDASMSFIIRESMFTPNSDIDLVEKVVQAMANSPKVPAVESMVDVGGYFDYFNDNAISALNRLEVPVAIVNAGILPVKNDFKVESHERLLVKGLPNVGHFLMMEAPLEFNHLLDQTIEEMADIASSGVR